MGAKTRLFFRCFRGVSHVTGTLPTYGLRYLPPAGGGEEGGTARTVCPSSARHPGLPPSVLPPLGGGPRRWSRGGDVSSARASLLFPIMSAILPRRYRFPSLAGVGRKAVSFTQETSHYGTHVAHETPHDTMGSTPRCP